MIGAFQQSELKWTRQKWWKQDYDLRDGDATLATMSWGWGSRATITWNEAAYDIRTTGFFKRRSVMSAMGSQQPVATFTHREQALTLTDGQVFHLIKPRLFSRERLWVDPAGNVLATVSRAHGATTVALSQPATSPALPLLVLFGGYLMQLAIRDEETASTSAVVATMGGAG